MTKKGGWIDGGGGGRVVEGYVTITENGELKERLVEDHWKVQYSELLKIRSAVKIDKESD